MAGFTVKIDSIIGGIAPSQNIGASNQFDSSIGIDPDMPITDSSVRVSGILRPVGTSKFSSTNVTSTPLWFLTNPKDALIYAYMADGKVVSYTNALTAGSEVLVGTPTSGAGNGACYYDNYLYFTTPTDVSRYGPLNGAATLTNTYWSGTLAQTALVNTTYPTVNSVTLPNHVMHYHAPTHKLYFVDVVNGKGTIHYIATTKTTVEGDTNNGSTTAILTTTPWGYLPTCMASYGSDLAIGCVQGTNATTLQKNATILFWDTVATAPTKTIAVELPDPLVTAMKNVNGVLYVWLGNAQGGTRCIRFAGGYSWQEVAFLEESYPPLPGAVDQWMNRVIFGGNTTYPEASACVWALGSKNAQLNAQGTMLNNIINTTSAGTNRWVTACKYVLQGDNKIRQPIVGWKDGSSQGIDKVSTTYGVNVWRSQIFNIGRPFQVNRIRFLLAQPVAANMTVTPKIYTDELNTSYSLQAINNTNYPNSDINITQNYKGSISAKGQHSFFLELRWTGTALCTLSLPITIFGEIIKDAAE